MPIEFRCSQCGKLLRTGDDTAGRQAQCPECGALSRIPDSPAAAAGTPPLAPLGAESPFTPGVAPQSPFASGPRADDAQGSENPYQSPSASTVQVLVGGADPFAAQRVAGPATALIVTAILGIIVQAVGIVANLVQIGIGAHVRRNLDMFPAMAGGGINLAAGLFGLAMGALILMGANKMKNLESFNFAMTAAIIAMIPCISPCCLLGLPFGIWALVVLNDSSVKAAFRS